MGEPKFSRPRTQTPTHPWKQARIDEEHDLKERYGLKKVGGMRDCLLYTSDAADD